MCHGFQGNGEQPTIHVEQATRSRTNRPQHHADLEIFSQGNRRAATHRHVARNRQLSAKRQASGGGCSGERARSGCTPPPPHKASAHAVVIVAQNRLHVAVATCGGPCSAIGISVYRASPARSRRTWAAPRARLAWPLLQPGSAQSHQLGWPWWKLHVSLRAGPRAGMQ